MRLALCTLWLVTAALVSVCAHAVPWTVTVSGTIYLAGTGASDNLGLFAAPGTVLTGLSYTETISTDPSLNTYEVIANADLHSTYGGSEQSAGSGAAYTITTTVNGVAYT